MSVEQRSLVLINGSPGTGKTTLKERLAADLHMPTLGKDDIKEFLFDTLGIGDVAWSSIIGRTSIAMLNGATEALLDSGYDVVVENAFIYEFAYPDLSTIVQRTGAKVLELYCQTSDEIRRERFDGRIASGQRHPGHSDVVSELSAKELAERYAPLNIGQTHYIDTTEFGDAEYTRLLSDVQTFIKEGRDD